ncbi:MAG: extracellular solute-binding protein [Chloroflexi bacterium]|nr:extracellular solute-binding protein [Chloroflexota bacterium]
MVRQVTAILLTLFVFSAFACSAGTGTIGPAATAVPRKPEVAQRPGETKWQKTLEAARQENTVVVYTTAVPEARLAFSNALKDKYGLEMQFVVGRGTELVAKILAERRAGLYSGDVYIAGSGTAVESLLPAGALDPLSPELILPEATDGKYWYGGRLPFVEKTETLLAMRGDLYRPVAINTTLVKPEEIVSYRNLLEPKFKGKIIMGDPTVPGTANATATGVAEFIMGYDFIKELVGQEPAVLRDERLVADWLARGKYSVTFGARSDLLGPLKAAGAPVQEIIPREGTFINATGVTVSLQNRRPHPNAARVFVNWLLTQEGQTVYVKGYAFDSLREDVAPSSPDPRFARQAGKEYKLVVDAEEWVRTQEKGAPIFRQLISSLLK